MVINSASQNPTSTPAPTSLWARSSEGPPRNANVLVVEDDQGVRETTVAILREEGYVVVQAADGADALELLRGTRHRRAPAGPPPSPCRRSIRPRGPRSPADGGGGLGVRIDRGGRDAPAFRVGAVRLPSQARIPPSADGRHGRGSRSCPVGARHRTRWLRREASRTDEANTGTTHHAPIDPGVGLGPRREGLGRQGTSSVWQRTVPSNAARAPPFLLCGGRPHAMLGVAASARALRTAPYP